MSKKDRGWEYLNSSGDDFDYDQNNDGSWGYENDDGSGSFYGADGSWGYKNSDGSASYHGADGSWGYKNADGSSSYYGNDGSWGYKNSDGSGSFYGSDNESEYYNSDDDDDEYSGGSGDVGGGAAAIGALLGLGLVALAARKSRSDDYSYDEEDDDEDDEPYYDEEYIRQQQEKERARQEEAIRRAEVEQAKKDRRKAKFKRFWSAIAHKKMIDINIKSSDCIGENYLKVISLFEKNGFSKIQTNIIENLEYCEIDKENLVTGVTVAGSNYFEMTTQVKYDSEVIITLHKLKRVMLPLTFKEAKKLPGDRVVSAFLEAGFIDVKENVIRDITFGLLKKDGAVDSVTVAGDARYRTDGAYRIDTPIVITYHTFKNK